MGNEIITELHLIRYCRSLNEMMGTPKEAFFVDHWGVLIPQAGHIGWDHVAGLGYSLTKMSEGGGESHVGCGLRCTKRELLSRLQAMIDVAHWMEDGSLSRRRISATDIIDCGYNTRNLYGSIMKTAVVGDTKELWIAAFAMLRNDYWSHNSCPSTKADVSDETGAAMLRVYFLDEIADMKGGDA